MASPLCFPLSQISLKIDRSALVTRPSANQRSPFAFKYVNSIFHSRHVLALGSTRSKDCSFAGGLRITIRPNLRTFHLHRKSYGVHASWLANSQIASSVFTLGTAAVLPFYTLMVVAPKAELLPGIAKLFSSEMTLASAWIHLLAVDLFAARQVFLEGLENEIETRHSVSLCLFFCPIGIVTHVITKALSKSSRNAEQRLH